jgi:hypothetical protein
MTNPNLIPMRKSVSVSRWPKRLKGTKSDNGRIDQTLGFFRARLTDPEDDTIYNLGLQEFANREVTFDWIIDSQGSWRNLSPESVSYLIGMR